MINLNVLAGLLPLLSSPKKSIRKEAAWTISNISAGTKEQLEAIINSDIFPRIINMILHDDFEIKKEAIWAVCNAVSVGSPADIAYLVKNSAIEAVSSLLSVKDSRTLIVAMEGIRYMLKCGQEHFPDEQGRNSFAIIFDECGGLEKTEQLQFHQNPQVYKKAVEVIEANFATEENENDELIQAIKAIAGQTAVPPGQLNF
jgi:importin subunit alpha-1